MNYDPNQITAQEQLTESSSSNSTVWLIVGGIVCVFLLLMAAGIATVLILGYQLAEAVADSQQKANANRTKAGDLEEIAAASPVVTITSPPDSIDQALSYLRSQSWSGHQLAFSYLKQKNNFDPERRTEVCDALLASFRIRRGVSTEPLDALKPWVNADYVSRLEDELDGVHHGRSLRKLMELLAETAGVDAAPALAQRIHQGGDRLLEKMGPEAADAVLPYMNSSDATVRNSVRQMLAKWEIDENSLIRHCLADLEDSQRNTRSAAADFILHHDGPVDDKLKKEIAIRVETLLIDGGPVFVSLLDKFSRGEETEKVIVAGLKANPSNIAILNVVAEMDSEIAIDALAVSFFSDTSSSSHSHSSIALWKKGSPLVAKKMVEHLAVGRPHLRFRATSLIKHCKGGTAILFEKCIEYLNSDDQEIYEFAAETLSDIDVDDSDLDESLKQQASKAIANALGNISLTNEDDEMMKEVFSAASKWGDKEVAIKLKRFLKPFDSSTCRSALYALIELKQPATYDEIAKLLFKRSRQRYALRRAHKLGIGFEPALLSQIDNSELTNSDTAKLYFDLLGKVGGNKTLELLRQRVENEGSRSIQSKMQSVIRKIERKPMSERTSPTDSAETEKGTAR